MDQPIFRASEPDLEAWRQSVVDQWDQDMALMRRAVHNALAQASGEAMLQGVGIRVSQEITDAGWVMCFKPDPTVPFMQMNYDDIRWEM